MQAGHEGAKFRQLRSGRSRRQVGQCGQSLPVTGQHLGSKSVPRVRYGLQGQRLATGFRISDGGIAHDRAIGVPEHWSATRSLGFSSWRNPGSGPPRWLGRVIGVVADSADDMYLDAEVS